MSERHSGRVRGLDKGVRCGWQGMCRARPQLSVTRASWEERGLKMQLDRQDPGFVGLPCQTEECARGHQVGILERLLEQADPLDVGSRLGQRGLLDRGLLSGSPRAPRLAAVPLGSTSATKPHFWYCSSSKA